MSRHPRNLDAAPHDADAYDRDADDAAWDYDRDETRRPRKGLFGRLVGLVKFAALALPVTMFLYGSFADCSARPAAGWLGLIGSGACARNEMLGSVLSMQDNFALLKRLID
jgi:hypothetical protein